MRYRVGQLCLFTEAKDWGQAYIGRHPANTVVRILAVGDPDVTSVPYKLMALIDSCTRWAKEDELTPITDPVEVALVELAY